MNISGNKILDMLISLVLIYALLSILVSILLEWWNHKTKARGRMLKEAILQMLKDPIQLNYGYLFYNHYLIKGMRNAERRPPQYIPADLFAEVLIDVIASGARHRMKIQIQPGEIFQNYQIEQELSQSDLKTRFDSELKLMKPSPLSDTLNDFWEKSDKDLGKMKEFLASWFNAYMDRVSGWYKNKQRKKFLIFGFIVAIFLNVDSLHLVKVLSLDNNLRNQLVNHAIEMVDQQQNQLNGFIQEEKMKCLEICKEGELVKPEEFENFLEYMQRRDDSLQKMQLQRIDSIMNVMSNLEIPIGWDFQSAPLSWSFKSVFTETKMPSGIASGSLSEYLYFRNQDPNLVSVFKYLIGILISGVSLSFGAPFWFDLLIKLVNLRQAGKKPESKTSSK